MEPFELEILSLPGGPAKVSWRRSPRARRVSLRIDPRDGSVVITLPPRAARRAGMALLVDHADWVSDRLAALPASIPFAPGAIIPINGVPHRIRHLPRGSALGGAWIEAGEIRVSGEAAFLQRRVADFLRAEAKRRLSLLVAAKSRLAGTAPRRIVIKDTRSRWGSCAPDGTLSFSWRLLMAPPFVQDYVAAHEVAHLRHLNHGTRFWALVDQLSPHVEKAMAWLHAEGARLLRVG
ncbi:MAG TPA: SprT family zinc-dependent metalloprotease [Acetobacteraceae bacterium]|nr:SprT family zinc-dependent metalloprotease [Acetobacteraceae bacterium]